MRNIATACIFALAATAALSDTSEKIYEVKGYPKIGNCHTVAAEFGSRFERLTGLPVASARCTNIGSDHFDLEVTYLSDRELSLVSTADRAEYITGMSHFSSRAECEAVLSQERAVFTAETGLEPIVSYCFLSRYLNPTPWILRIDGFGDTALKPFNSHDSFFFHVGTDDRAAFATSLSQSLTQHGHNVRKVTIVPEMDSLAFGVLYYAPTRINFDITRDIIFDTRDQCANASVKIQTAFATYGESPVASICGNKFGDTRSRLNLLTILDSPLSLEWSADSFSSSVACEANRTSIVDTYTNDVGLNVIETMCAAKPNEWPQSSSWRVLLILR